ncbi:hypothetical protein [Pararhodobacter zhoushanensis]|uniref:hypothetical protein n=1 Tax=Pararhodobacter zhoushanensis TaxID=2479545 RepID=UPI000F8E97F6|nr:hypothetical protein [Pararhodobacter zhoushanensis]
MAATKESAAKILADSPFFDEAFYLSTYPDVRAAGLDPIEHYLDTGWQENRDPSAEFSTEGYFSANPDVATAQINPLVHYVRHGQAEGRKLRPDPQPKPKKDGGVSKLQQNMALIREQFDAEFYLRANPDVAASGMDPLLHYCQHGWIEARDPSPRFSATAYFRRHPDLANTRVNPLVHFVTAGGNLAVETVLPRTRHTANRAPGLAENVLATGLHPNQLGALISPYFDAEHYRAQLSDDANVYDLLDHFVTDGEAAGLDPHPGFSTRFYRASNPDVSEAVLNTFAHFILLGHQEGRLPHPKLSTLDPATGFFDTQPHPATKRKPLAEQLKPNSEAEISRLSSINQNQGLFMKHGLTRHEIGDIMTQPMDVVLSTIREKTHAAPTVQATKGMLQADMPLFHRLLPEIAPKADVSPQHAAFCQTLTSEMFQLWYALRIGALPDPVFGQHVDVQGLDLVRDALDSGARIVMVNAHVGHAWSIVQTLLRASLRVLTVAVTRGFPNLVLLKHPDLEIAALADRLAAGVTIQAARFLKKPGIVNILPDAQTNSGPKRRFLTRECMISDGFAHLAYTHADTLITAYSSVDESGKLIIRFGKELGDIPKELDRKEAVSTMVQRYTTYLEDWWRREPEMIQLGNLIPFSNAPRHTPPQGMA